MSDSKPFSKLVIPDDEPVVLFGTLYEERARSLAEEVIWHTDRPIDEKETIARIEDADCVINIRSSVKFTRNVLSHCLNLKILSVWGTGIDHVDLPAAEEFGITVSNTPAYGAPYVAEHALTLALAVSRQIVQSDKYVRDGGWTRGFINELYGKTLGVIGTGAIGQRMIQLGKAIGMNVSAWTLNPNDQRSQEYDVPFVTLHDLIQQSDVISIHLALSEKTRHLIGKAELSLMKQDSILINTARGAIVDEIALLDALQTNRIAGAGLDSFEQEPLPKDHPLTALDNVVLSPHAGGMAYSGTMRGLEMSVENLEAFAAGNPIYMVAKGPR
jgi:D-3-phosphoglycerate dehydrogenase